MAQVETASGPVEADSLGITLMHEHVFVLNEEERQNYPADWDEDQRVDDAVAKLTALAGSSFRTIPDPTGMRGGGDIAQNQQRAAPAPPDITAATDRVPLRGVPVRR